MENARNRIRMLHWMLLSVVCYWLAGFLQTMPAATPDGTFPHMQAVLWRVGHLNLGAFLGYWVDRHAFRDRILPWGPALALIRRAIIIAACIIGMAIAT